jgi:hypothetical protein
LANRVEGQGLRVIRSQYGIVSTVSPR